MTVTVCWTGKLDGNDWNLIWNEKDFLKICMVCFFSGIKKKKRKSQFEKSGHVSLKKNPLLKLKNLRARSKSVVEKRQNRDVTRGGIPPFLES